MPWRFRGLRGYQDKALKQPAFLKRGVPQWSLIYVVLEEEEQPLQGGLQPAPTVGTLVHAEGTSLPDASGA